MLATMFNKNSVIFILNILCINLVGAVLKGQAAHSGEFPGIVYVMYTNDPENKTGYPFCTGSIISELWVLSAGHCFDNITNQPVYVVGGINDLNGHDTEKQIRFVETIKIHPLYESKKSFSYDVALLKLWYSFDIGEKVKPVTFPENNITGSMTMSFVGSGYTRYGDIESIAMLQKYDLKIIEPNHCMKYYENFDMDEKSETFLCGLSNNNFTAPCFADSGGGLFIKGKPELGLYATLSFNYNCSSTSPAFFVSIRNILAWIKNVTDVGQSPQTHIFNNIDNGKNYFSSMFNSWTTIILQFIFLVVIIGGIVFYIKYNQFV